MYTHILIPTDGSELAQKGVDHGLALAKALGSKVTVVIATPPFPRQSATIGYGWVGSPVDYERYDEGQKQFSDNILSLVRADADKFGIDAETVHVAKEHPATAILETAASSNCDLIVMASHGRRGVKRMLLGSQTAEVVSSSPVPVLIVR